jgi:hypothetical protein
MNARRRISSVHEKILYSIVGRSLSPGSIFSASDMLTILKRSDDEWCGGSRMMFAHKWWLWNICKSSPKKTLVDEERNIVARASALPGSSRG